MSGALEPKVVAIGGGHGLAATLRAVSTYSDRVTAVVSVADDGGSSGRLRELLEIIPPGDLRKCLVAMAEPGSTLASLFDYRFADDVLSGHSLGNLILAALMDRAQDPVEALDEACRLLGVRGRVLPATTEPVVLKADADSGPVAGQVAVMATGHIRHVSLVPSDPVAPAEAVGALAEADQIVLGPGSLFTSVLAAIAVPEIRDGIERSGAHQGLRLQPPAPGPRDRGLRRRHARRGAGRTRGVGRRRPCRHVGARAREPGRLRWSTPRWPRPNGMAHDAAKLAVALSDLLK